MAKPSSPRLFRRDDKLSGEASFRVLYYGAGAGAVPFTWESQPGTPKHTFSGDPLPPLTPPPSYKFSPQQNNPSLQKNNSPRFLNSIFPKVHSRKIINSASMSFSSTSSSFSSSYSLPSTPFNARKNIKYGSSGTSVIRFDFDEYENGSRKNYSPTSTLCFGPGNGSACRRRSKVKFYSIKSVKKMVLSMVGRGRGN